MKLNKTAIFYLLAFVIVILLTYFFFSFDFVAGNLSTSSGQNGDLRKKGEVVSFSFVAKADQISGIILYSVKPFYVVGEKEKRIELSLNCGDKTASRDILLSDLAIAGFQEIALPPIFGCLDRSVDVEIKSLDDLGDNIDLRIDNQDRVPGEVIDTAPRVIYHQTARGLLDSCWRELLRDNKFSKIYLAIISVVLLFCLLLVMIDISQERKSRRK